MTFLPCLLHALEMTSRLSTHPLEHPCNAPDNEAEARPSTFPAGCPHDDALDNAETPTSSTWKGSFNYDHEKGEFSMNWASVTQFDVWHQAEELAYSIEFITAQVINRGTLYLERCVYVCLQQASGRLKNYQKKCPGHQHKIESKKISCACWIMIKHYHHTQMILGWYAEEHNHNLGMKNITYTWLSHKAQDQIQLMLHQKVDPWEIVHIYSTIYFSSWSNPSIDYHSPKLSTWWQLWLIHCACQCKSDGPHI